jgi:RNA-directed DNA polymerase
VSLRVPKQGTGAEQSVVGMKPAKTDGPKGLRHSASNDDQPEPGRNRSSEAKPFKISKKIVWEAYEKVKKNRGAAGVDSESIEEFERNLKNNLYRIWNRMSSGTYFPPPVRKVEIAKHDGGLRTLGIPTVSDRIAQTVAKLYLEPIVEPHFDPDSYGYRPGKSAIDAVRAARTNCWRFDWLIDLDVRAFFDSLDHDLAMRAIRKYTRCPWILLYLERWLKAPLQNEDGTLVARERGTPQGGVVSPVVANLFLHLAFDAWMREAHPDASCVRIEVASIFQPKGGGES